jgi:DHA2 family multidrug resistance protein-like MFS transporter
MAVLLITGPILLPEHKDPNPGKFDLLSAIMSLAAVLLVIYGLKQVAENGLTLLAAVTVPAGVVIGILFVNRQRTLADPLIDLRLFRVPAFSASLATYTLGIFSGFGIFLFIAQYLQLVLGLSPLQAGLYSVPGAIAFVFGSNLAPKVVQRVRPAYVVAGGLAVAAVGMALLIFIGTDSLALIVAGNTIMSIGFGFTFTLTVDLVVGAAPPERSGAASALAETGAELGGALGLAVLGSLGVAVYRSQVTATMPPGISPEMVEAVRETLGGAVVVAEQLPAEVANALLSAARQAFIYGIQINAVIGVIGFLSLVVITLTMLRDLRPHDESAEEEQPASGLVPAPSNVPVGD